jgi:two-component system cell cycle sensor histidine kinase/response regulator CckA
MNTDDKTILLVEDDPAILKLTSRILASLGYAVIAAENGTQALELYPEKKAEINVVITDMQMPDMSGGELAEKLRADNQDLAIIFISGYTEDQLSDNLDGEHLYFIQKPFTKATLSEGLETAMKQQA